jgi:Fe-Mn family superoxide dismutase
MKWQNLTEATKPRKKLEQESLPYKRTELAPVMSKQTLVYHYGKLAGAYVERYNNGEGDSDFNYGGATLHNIFFPQLQKPQKDNAPQGLVAALIERKFGSYSKFQDDVEKTAMGIQGSGWVYLDKIGNIKIIANHELNFDPDRIILLIDWWEHAWALDYQWDKKKYLKNIWQIINWSVVEERLRRGKQ